MSNPVLVELVIDKRAGRASDISSFKPARRYMLSLIVFMIALWLLPLLLIRLPDFLRWSGSQYGWMLEYGFTDINTDADVVIFGDSSALFGIDPQQIARSLGVTAINLPNVITSLPVTRDLVLSQYLAHHPAPRLIVFYFAPWNLNYDHVDDPDKLYEGEEMLARHGSARQMISFASKHWREAALFPFEFYAANSITGALSRIKDWRQIPPIVPSRGHTALHLPRDRLLKPSCVIPTTVLRKTQIGSAATLADKYGAGTSKVVTYMAPIPSCVNAGQLADVPYALLAAAPPKQMNTQFFADDGSYIHIDAQGVPQATADLIAAIRSVVAN